MRLVSRMCASVAVLCLVASNNIALAQDDPSTWREIETKYIFGFTEGSGIGLEGENELSIDTVARLGKAGSRYFGSETKVEFEFTPSQYIQIEFGSFISAHSIKNIAGLTDLNQVTLGGFFGEIRYLLLERGPNSPLSITLSAEPEFRRIDETGGDRVTNFEGEFKVNADLEVIPNRVFLGSNLLYEPEWTRDPGATTWERESKVGVSAALAFRVMPNVVVGGEVWYLRHYDGIWLNSYTGDAIYVGPTLYLQLTPKMFVAAAWDTQVSGHDLGDPSAHLNLTEFSRQRARLKVAFEF